MNVLDLGAVLYGPAEPFSSRRQHDCSLATMWATVHVLVAILREITRTNHHYEERCSDMLEVKVDSLGAEVTRPG